MADCAIATCIFWGDTTISAPDPQNAVDHPVPSWTSKRSSGKISSEPWTLITFVKSGAQLLEGFFSTVMSNSTIETLQGWIHNLTSELLN
ncbi:hypothetical protein EVAR_800_1 [Eumeta japonica]|uniref:Uncharacterized protein n=1 Tax=Eumeta variegata TaxID=151549 RepID=A0A4C1SC74_EUMVA|nr:hypothetical protein EVAR_800_1 [Eumeta japonica]